MQKYLARSVSLFFLGAAMFGCDDALSASDAAAIIDGDVAVPDGEASTVDAGVPPRSGDWATQAGGEGELSQLRAYDVTVDDTGHSYVVGTFVDEGIFGDVTLYGSGALESFVAKLSPDGEFLWSNLLGGDRIVAARVELYDDSEIVVSGSFRGRMMVGDEELLASDSEDSVFIARLDGGGSTLWATALAGSGNVAVANDGFRILTRSGSDMAVSRTDESAVPGWTAQARYAEGRALTVGESGSTFVTGAFGVRTGSPDGSAVFGPFTVDAPGLGHFETFVAKIDAAGNYEWVSTGGGEGWIDGFPRDPDGGTAIALDALGNVYVTGSYGRNAVFGEFEIDGNDRATFVAKLSPTGEFLWVRAMPTDVINLDIAVSDSGHSYVGGFTWGSAAFGAIEMPRDGYNLFAARLDSAGDFVWAKIGFSSAVGNDLSAIALGTDENVFVAGELSLALECSDIMLTPIGRRDAFVWRAQSADLSVP